MKWLKNWFSRNRSALATAHPFPAQPQGSRKKRRSSFQPKVEQLEEKVLLSTFAPTYTVHHQSGHTGPEVSSAQTTPHQANKPRLK
jgi:hypothetical protein